MVTWAPSGHQPGGCPEPDAAATPGDQRRQPGDPRPAVRCHWSCPDSSWFGARPSPGRATECPVDDARRSRRPTSRAGRGGSPMSVRMFNLADLFEVVVDTVPDGTGAGRRSGPAHLPPARRAGQPLCPLPAGPGHRAGGPRGDPGLQPGRMGGGDDRLLQGAHRPGQPQLPLRGPRAALRHRQRRPRARWCSSVPWLRWWPSRSDRPATSPSS